MNPDQQLSTQPQPIDDQGSTTPPVVHVVRGINPVKPTVSPEVQRLHERSLHLFPTLNLSDGEYVIRSVRRHPIGLIAPVVIGVFLIAMAITVMFSYEEAINQRPIPGLVIDPALVNILALLFIVISIIGMAVSAYVYLSNKFFLTNESVIQEIQHSLFSRHEQTVSLANIEDASFTQKGIIQHIFNYGDVRLSTEGDETTYRFSYVANPKAHVDKLNNVVEAFKNGRPVEDR